MCSLRILLAIGSGILATYVQGAHGAKYCYCETKLGIPALGIEKQCTPSGGDWTPVNCGIGGNADVCKFANDVEEEQMKKLEDWCNNQIATSDGKPSSVGGTVKCVDTIPDWAKDESCGDKKKNRVVQKPHALPSLHRRATDADAAADADDADDDGTKYLRYVPEGENLVATDEIVLISNNWSRFIQINELRLIKTEWVLVKGYDNRRGKQPHTKEVKVKEGFEKVSSSKTSVSLKVNFAVSFPYVSAGVEASAAQEWYSEQKTSRTVEYSDTFLVGAGDAAFLYQKVLTWETTAWFRWEVNRIEDNDDWRINGKHPEGNWTVEAHAGNKPLTSALKSQIRLSDFYLAPAHLHKKGKFSVEDDWEIVKPLYPKDNLRSVKDLGGTQRDRLGSMGIKDN